MNEIMIIGLLAGLCTTLSFIPQIVKIYRTRRTKDLSLSTYVLLSVGLFLWVVYGVVLNQIAIVLPNIIVLGMALYIIVLKIKNG
jgi:MtN3 and saliva related transmembrane protein